jgi:hypothetical protein
MSGPTFGCDKFDHHNGYSETLVGSAFHFHFSRDLIAGNKDRRAQLDSDTDLGMM